LEKRLGVRGSYYFRVVKQSFDAGIIREIAAMGHEIGYHYENLAKAGQRLEVRGQGKGRREKGKTEDERMRGCEDEEGKKEKESLPTQNSKLKTQNSIFELALEDFKQNLEKLREICPIKTICMHGSPLSKYDSRDLWEKYDYRDFGIIAEPYFDVDFEEVLYLTDTGRRWDGEKYSVRDKVTSKKVKVKSKKELGDRSKEVGDSRQETVDSSWESTQNSKLKIQNYLHSTQNIIRAAEQGLLPEKIMINVHPQRWTKKPLPWVKELIWQNVKNVIKRSLLKRLEGKSKKGKC
jgi:hypothetical protein